MTLQSNSSADAMYQALEFEKPSVQVILCRIGVISSQSLSLRSTFHWSLFGHLERIRQWHQG